MANDLILLLYSTITMTYSNYIIIKLNVLFSFNACDVHECIYSASKPFAKLQVNPGQSTLPGMHGECQ